VAKGDPFGLGELDAAFVRPVAFVGAVALLDFVGDHGDDGLFPLALPSTTAAPAALQGLLGLRGASGLLVGVFVFTDVLA
jgi:hypothetical protein